MISFINDDNLAIQYDGDFSLTKQVASFKNFKIKGDVSISFTVPNTSDNRKALGYYGLNQIDSPIFSPSKFNLVKNGNILMRGDLIIESDSQKEITLYFISGNANWFREFDFSCKRISNNGYQLRWNYASILRANSNTKGIIFPCIDYMFKREKFDNSAWYKNHFGTESEYGDVYNINNFPCLYLNTLVDEICKVANVKINGNLLEDKLYKSLVVTPEGPDIRDENGNRIFSAYAGSTSVSGGDYDTGAGIIVEGASNLIRIEYIAPDIKAIEIIKWLCFKFGCIPYYDEYSRTITLNIIDKIDKNDSLDWSAYVQSYEIDYDQSEDYYIRVPDADEEDIQLYNRENPEALFGELNINTEKPNGAEIDLYTDIFLPSKDDVGSTPFRWATPYVKFYELEDDEPLEYTSVTNNGPYAVFNGAFNLGLVSASSGLIFRVVDDNNTYTGYHVSETNVTNSLIQSSSTYSADSTGTIYLQKLTEVQSGARVLVCIPNYPVNAFTSGNELDPLFLFTNPTHVAYAYWYKPFYSEYFSLNGYKQGLSWGAMYWDETEPYTQGAGEGGGVTPSFEITLHITAELSTSDEAKIYYKKNTGSWTLLLQTTVPVYPSYTDLTAYKISVNLGDSVYLGVKNDTDQNVTFGLTDTASASYTGYCGQDDTTVFIVSESDDKYINMKCTSGTPNTLTTC